MNALMLAPVTLMCLAALSPSEEASHFVVHEFERVGRANPSVDAALAKAASSLAELALDTSAAEAADLTNLTAAISQAGGWEPTPRALILKGAPLAEPLASLRRRSDLPDEPASHYGVGWAQRGEVGALVVLLASRRAELEPFARTFSKGASNRRLCARLDDRFASAELYVTQPKGSVEKLPLRRLDERFCADVGFATEGRHTVEILARGDKGPEVVALFFVRVGAAGKGEKSLAEVEPTSDAEARARLVSRINALRAGFGLTAVAIDSELDAVAQPYAERMATENFFAHVAPDGSDVRRRLKLAGYPYRTAGENLGQASGPMAAHFGLEHSPGHRKNLLDPAYSAVGLGIAKNAQGQTVLVEVLAEPMRVEGSPFEQAYGSLQAARKAKGLRPLSRVPLLEQLATEHAKAALAADTPRSQVGGASLHDKIFAADDELESAAVDFYVADSPAMITESKNLGDPRSTLVGVGVAKGDSPTYGKGKYWVVVVYASPR